MPMCFSFFNRVQKYTPEFEEYEPYSETTILPKKEPLVEAQNNSQLSKEILVSRNSPICHIQRSSVDTCEYRYRISVHNKLIDACNRRSTQINR